MNYIDMLSCLGAGSAHPGGFSASLEQFHRFPLPHTGHILEVGCGTGRTACYLAEQGYYISAIDIRTEMLIKAKKRAAVMGVDVRFTQSDVCTLPFPDEHFDVIIAESVTNFTQADRSISEYYRVLKPGGILYDREMFVREPLPNELFLQLSSFFGIPQLMNQNEWVTLLMHNHFKKVDFVDVNTFNHQSMEAQYQFPDPHQFIDEGAFLDGQVWQSSAQHTNLITDSSAYLAYGLIKATK
jgi:ubiquinone/menaquinone biosynthesis C-methylase UbiE